MHNIPDTAVDVRPASNSQRGMWLTKLLQPRAPAYVVTEVFDLTGPLDIDALSAAFDTLLARHAMLMTGVAELDGDIVQYRLPAPRGKLEVLRLPDGESAESQISQLAESLASEPFDLARPPLARARTVILTPERAVLILCFHHAAVDEASMPILFNGIGTDYAAYQEASEQETAEALSISPDSASDEQAWLSSTAYQRLLRERCDELEPGPAVIHLPRDSPSTGDRREPEPIKDLAIDRSEVEPLLELAREEGITPFSALLCAFSAVVSRWTAQSELIIGMTVSTRDDFNADCVGMYVNLVPARIDLSGDPLPLEAMRRVGAAVMNGLAARTVPFDQLVRALPSLRRASRPPIVQVTFDSWDELESSRELNIPRVHSSPRPAPALRTEFDLSFGCLVSQSGLVACADWHADGFAGRLAPTLLRDFRRALRWISSERELRLSEWDIEYADIPPVPQ